MTVQWWQIWRWPPPLLEVQSPSSAMWTWTRCRCPRPREKPARNNSLSHLSNFFPEFHIIGVFYYNYNHHHQWWDFDADRFQDGDNDDKYDEYEWYSPRWRRFVWSVHLCRVVNCRDRRTSREKERSSSLLTPALMRMVTVVMIGSWWLWWRWWLSWWWWWWWYSQRPAYYIVKYVTQYF